MSKKALFIVEGDREEEYVSQIAEVMEIDVKVYPVKANIYMLYSKLKAEDFQLNIVDTLLEMKGVEDRYKQILREGDAFAYTYLLFDLDIQDNDKPIGDNYKIVREMLEYFIDETDEPQDSCKNIVPDRHHFRHLRRILDHEKPVRRTGYPC